MAPIAIRWCHRMGRVAYSGYDWNYDTYNVSLLYAMRIDGSSSRALTATMDRSLYSSPYYSPPRSFWWAPDSSGVYFNLGDRGTRNLHFASLTGEVRQITRGNHILTVTDVSSTGRAVGTATSFHQPAEIVSFTLQDSEFEYLTSINADLLEGLSLGDVEEIWYSSVDGLRIQGWIVKPPGFDPAVKYPLILSIHGGPHGMYGVGFNFGLQLHAAKDYVVLYTNPRGSTGYGHRFGNATNRAFPGKDFDDLMRGVDEIVARGYVDQRNLFVYGGSAGGILTAWVVGHTDRFAAASANYPVTNWLSFVGTSDGISFLWNFDKLPWEDPSEHLARSPLMYAGNVSTPTLLMTGELDLSTPISQTEEFYRALKMRDVPTAMIRFNEEYHGTGSKPSNFMRTHAYLWHWFERYKR